MSSEAGRDRLGIYAWFGHSLPLCERLAMVRAAGFGAASVWWGEDEEVFRAGLRHLIPGMAADAGLVLESIHPPFDRCNDLWSESAPAREALLGAHRSCVEECAQYSIRRMVIHLTRGDDPPPLTPAGVSGLARLAAEAEERGVVVAVENTRRPEYLERVFAEVPSPGLGLCYDSSHARLWGGTPLLLGELGRRLATTHWSDNDGTRDCHWLPGEGVIDWPEVAGAFPHDTYTGYTMLEVLPKDETPTESAEEFLAHAHTTGLWLARLLHDRPAADSDG